MRNQADTTRVLLQTSWELLQQGRLVVAVAPSSPASETAVFVGIQQMEYGGLATPHLHGIGPFSGKLHCR